MDLRTGIQQTAQALGINPVDLATAISYETAGTFDPTKRGPTTQWGQHRGLIQFGEPQAQKYGVNWDDPLGSQLGPNGAVANYLRDTGVQPGMGLLDIYSAINAGGVGRYGASDANNGGAPGTVRDKVEQQMAAHRRKAQELFEGGPQMARQPGLLGNPVISTQGQAPKERWWNDDRRDRLILGLEGMTLNPNRGLMMAASQGLKERAEGRKEAKVSKQEAERRNRTAEWLASRGREDLAQAVAGGMIDAKSAVTEAIKPAGDDRTAMAKNYEFLINQGMSPEEALQAVRGGTSVSVTNQIGPSTPGEETLDKELAKDLNKFIQGGAADMSKNLAQLKQVRERIGGPDAPNVTGPVIGNLPDWAGAVLNPEAVDVREQVEEVVQRNLREVLGAQFTEKEGERLIARAWNPRLDEATNLARLDRLIKQIELAYQSKASAAAYFRENGTLKGWEGTLPSINDFSLTLDEGEKKRLRYNPETGGFE